MPIPSHYASLSALELAAITLLELKGAWTLAALAALHERDRQEVFDAGVQLLRSASARERERGVGLLFYTGWPNSVNFEERRARGTEILLSALSTEQDVSVLQQMGRTLGHFEDIRSVRALLTLKDHPDARVRQGVVWGLRPHARHVSVALRTLLELSRDGDTSVRKEVLSGLSLVGEDALDTPELRDAFFDRLSEEDAGIRAKALLGLARRKDPRAREPLRRELERRPVAIEAIEAVRYLEDASFLPLLLAVREAACPMDEAFEDAIGFAIESLGGRAT
ncbi:hypothetical protein D7X96_02955 [Corallococcus interemptor]|uniref:HEAT repeat domain-containing protein n=1 Tax=Corallococcus interemptor TaxID=2316720 RepID=A0A3A8QW89_9BACT|nr:HEAT repeat domain-containing protein [Corallococcus interemptor]RKH73026.1 hypothetical protein D7X96_02955 [Corallococcus interemptor]